MMPQKPRSIPMSSGSKIFLVGLAIAYLGYLVGLANFLTTPVSVPSIAEHHMDRSSDDALRHWTATSMRNAINADERDDNASDFTAGSISTGKGQPAQQEGQPPKSGESSYPLSTVGKVFFTEAGLDYVCSGTATVSSNQSVVDTAGHCIWEGDWAQNFIFCPLYDGGSTPYGCWAARDLEVPADWIDARPDDLHHDMGMAIVVPNSKGALTDVVGGAGWAVNQRIEQPFYAYGYPAGYPFDGQTRQSCEGSIGRSWDDVGGIVMSIPCDMTGGSSGGPWFIQDKGNWYLNGHNDFSSSIQPDHLFSPYYDDTWHALYNEAQRT